MPGDVSEALRMRAGPCGNERVERAIRQASAALKIATFEAYRQGGQALAVACATIVLEIEDLEQLAKSTPYSSYDPLAREQDGVED